MAFSKKKAYLWLSENHIYTLKVKRTWYGSTIICQSCMHDCRRLWLDQEELLKKILGQVIDDYRLQEYTLSLLLSGKNLIWKSLALPTRKKKEALSMVIWEDAVGDGSQAYAVDVQMRQSVSGSDMPEWLLAAYPYDSILLMLDCLAKKQCTVQAIDVLPALAGRFCPGGKGRLYIGEPSHVHVITLKDGIPLAYSQAKALPAGGAQWLEERNMKDIETIVLWHDEKKDIWTEPVVTPAVQDTMARWNLTYFSALLAAY